MSVTPDSAPVVATDGGSVTLIDLTGLQARLTSLRRQVDSLTEASRSLRSLSEGLWIDRGRVLVKKGGGWTVPPLLAQLIAQATALEQQVEADDAKLQSIHSEEHHGLSGLVAKAGEWSESRKTTGDRLKLETQLHPFLLQLGRQAPDVTVPEADSLRVEALAADLQAQQLESQASGATAAADVAEEEIKRRSGAMHEMGFDAPYLAASLQANGPPAIESPLILKRGEQASLAVAATLARQQTRREFVGGSQGFSFPIGHTGIRYRVGSFRGHPVEQQYLGRLDTGTLVVTNQRLAFIGSTKSTSAVMAKLLHVECYSDALAIFQEGREKADYYYVAQPQYVLFYVNWFLNQATH